MTISQLTYFECVGYWYDVESPPPSGSTNTPNFTVLSAFVTFTPRLSPGSVEYITNLDLQTTVPSPAGLSVTGSTTGGTLTAGTYQWVVTSTNANGESTPTTTVNAVLTTGTSSAVLSWTAQDGATGYKVYRIQGATTKLVGAVTTPTYTDTGTAGTTATLPTTNTAELTANTGLVIAPIQARIFEGELQTIDQANTPGVQLLANTPVLGLTTLIYDVTFTDVVYAGQPQVLANFGFTAPSTNTVIDLGDPNLDRLAYDPTNYT